MINENEGTQAVSATLDWNRCTSRLNAQDPWNRKLGRVCVWIYIYEIIYFLVCVAV